MCFLFKDETIQHLFFECHYAKFIWRAVHFSFHINEPKSVQQMCHGWLNTVDAKERSKIFVGAIAICWPLWLTRNDIVFEESSCKTYMQILFRGICWCRFWALIRTREEDTSMMKTACRTLKATVMQLIINHGWRFTNRIAF